MNNLLDAARTTDQIEQMGLYQAQYYQFSDQTGVTKKTKQEIAKDQTISEIGRYRINYQTYTPYKTMITTVTQYYHSDGYLYNHHKPMEMNNMSVCSFEGASITLYRGSPYKGEGEVPVVIQTFNQFKLKSETYYSLNLDSPLVTYLDSNCGWLFHVFSCLDGISDLARIWCCIFKPKASYAPIVEPGDFREVRCIVPVSEYLEQSIPCKGAVSWEENIAFLQVKNGGVESINLHERDLRGCLHDNFVVIFSADLKKNIELDYHSALDEPHKTCVGYITKRLKCNKADPEKIEKVVKSWQAQVDNK